MARKPGPEGASRAAYAAAGMNLAAALAMLLVMRPGLPGAESGPAERLAFISAHLWQWWGGWLLWHAAAVLLLAFYVGLAREWWAVAPIRCGLALLCGAGGLAADLSGQALYMGLTPRLDAEGFAVLEAAVGMLSGYVGNGLYTLGGALLTWAGARELPRALVLISLPIWAAGVALSVGSLGQLVEVQLWSNVVLMPSFVVWCTLIGRWLAGRAPRAS